MPWSPKDASKKTKKANTPEEKKKWAKTANSVLSQSGDESKAIKIANATINKKKK